MQHAAYSETTNHYVLPKSTKEIRTLKCEASAEDRNEKANLVKIIAAKQADAVPVQETVMVDECAYDRNHSRLCDQFHKKRSNNATDERNSPREEKTHRRFW